jgi:hypothetical protein
MTGPRIGLPGGLGRMGPGVRIPVGRGGMGGLGLIAAIVVLLLLALDPTLLLQGTGGFAPYEDTAPRTPADDELRDFVAVVLGDTEDTWNQAFEAMGRPYEEPRLVLFSGSVASACGYAGAAVGPFYCPADSKVYLDLSFFADLKSRFGAPGDFAEAYVVAHEVGHHVQNLLGIGARVRAMQARSSEVEANALSVRMELQADCLAGVWANRADAARDILEAGDIEEALDAAAAIGDDRLQREATGQVTPDSFTHGTSEQRARWFRRGLDSGDLAACDPFAAAAP